MEQMDNQDAYRQACCRVDAKLGFYGHIGIYIAVNLLLVVINLTTSPHYFWFIWPLLGWGIGVTAHGVGTFLLLGRSGTLRGRPLYFYISAFFWAEI